MMKIIGKNGVFLPSVSAFKEVEDGKGVNISSLIPKTADPEAGVSVGVGILVGVGFGVLVGVGETVGEAAGDDDSSLSKTGLTSKFDPAEKFWVSSQLI